MTLETRNSDIYDNILVLHPDGDKMFYCSIKKSNYYLNNDLAKLVATEPEVTIQLTFEPEGKGNDENLLVKRENKCVVCESTKNLTNHHVIPRSFRDRSKKLKKGRHHDLLPMCEKHHVEYETNYVPQFKEALIDILELDRSKMNLKKAHVDQNKAIKFANTLLEFADEIPQDRKDEMKHHIKESFDLMWVTKRTLDEVSKTEPRTVGQHSNIEHFILEQYDDHNHIAQLWRKHFLDKMDPSYIPEDFQYIVDNEIKLKELSH